MYTFVFRSKVYTNIKDIESHYNSIDVDLYSSFLSDFNSLLDRIIIFPEIYQLSYKNIRIGFLEAFPYGIHYEIIDDKIIIYAILHTSQEIK
ncbi:type II toxin-antitoxin system RelE/ParE family toxin [Tenacibaculum sp. M341]|uniref:type II toxin-antitoxin system RelE/ParE family toxin n=1 Tax=Tenacibaculum sp. M341 TaxID=2530339 RepID=UPI00104294EF|nr:hypothetical protein EYW44_04075 [Tenacibaculum sp. M341]